MLQMHIRLLVHNCCVLLKIAVQCMHWSTLYSSNSWIPWKWMCCVKFVVTEYRIIHRLWIFIIELCMYSKFKWLGIQSPELGMSNLTSFHVIVENCFVGINKIIGCFLLVCFFVEDASVTGLLSSCPPDTADLE